MGRLIILLCIILSIGCANTETIKTETQEVKIPVLFCPKPNIPPRPNLLFNNIPESELNNHGRVVQYFEGSIQQLLFYIYELETILKLYETNAIELDKEE